MCTQRLSLGWWEMFLALGREGTRAALLEEASLCRHGTVRCPAGQTKTPNQAHGCSSHPPFFSMSLWSRLTLQPYKTVGKCVNLGLLGMGAHPVVDVGLPAGDRDEDPLFCRIAACPCNILSCSCAIHPIQAVTLNSLTPCRARCHSHGSLADRREWLLT